MINIFLAAPALPPPFPVPLLGNGPGQWPPGHGGGGGPGVAPTFIPKETRQTLCVVLHICFLFSLPTPLFTTETVHRERIQYDRHPPKDTARGGRGDGPQRGDDAAVGEPARCHYFVLTCFF